MTRPRLDSLARPSLLAAALAVAFAAPAAAAGADDDLQAVKRAVLASNASTSVAQARPPAEDPAPRRAEALPREPSGGPRWLRVRVLEKGGRGGRVSVNLPIGLVRTLGDEWPVPGFGCRKRDRCGTTLGEILRALDGGQSLVEIEDAEASVRVWID